MREMARKLSLSTTLGLLTIFSISVSGLSSAAPASRLGDTTPVPVVTHRGLDVFGIGVHNQKAFGLAKKEKQGRMSKSQENRTLERPQWPWRTCFYPPCPWEEDPFPWDGSLIGTP